jgi:hypothetical protein
MRLLSLNVKSIITNPLDSPTPGPVSNRFRLGTGFATRRPIRLPKKIESPDSTWRTDLIKGLGSVETNNRKKRLLIDRLLMSEPEPVSAVNPSASVGPDAFGKQIDQIVSQMRTASLLSSETRTPGIGLPKLDTATLNNALNQNGSIVPVSPKGIDALSEIQNATLPPPDASESIGLLNGNGPGVPVFPVLESAVPPPVKVPVSISQLPISGLPDPSKLPEIKKPNLSIDSQYIDNQLETRADPVALTPPETSQILITQMLGTQQI